MKRIWLCLATVAILATTVSAQDNEDTVITGWQKSLIFDLGVTQAAYSDSWTGGEAGQMSWAANLNGTAEKYLSSLVDYRTTLKMSFGQTLSQNPDTKEWERPKKSTDLIDWEHLFLFKLDSYVEPYGAFRIETQFYDGRVRDKKLFFSPLKLTQSAGIARRIYKKQEDVILTRVGAAVQENIVQSIVGVDTVNNELVYLTDDTTYIEGGVEWVTDAVLSFHDNLKYIGKLTLFKAFLSNEEDSDPDDSWKTVDVNWESTLSAAVTRIVSVNLYTQLLYDKQVIDQGRWKQTLGIGVTFRLM